MRKHGYVIKHAIGHAKAKQKIKKLLKLKGPPSFFNFLNFLLSFGMFNNISMFPHSGKKKLQVTSYVILENKT